jgi:hypothetical protein
MMKALLLVALVGLVGCGSKKHAPPVDPAPLIAAAHDLADRGCKCDTDKECIKAIRDEWDAQKDQLLAAHNAAVDAEISRLKMCGDAAGLTFWDH